MSHAGGLFGASFKNGSPAFLTVVREAVRPCDATLFVMAACERSEAPMQGAGPQIGLLEVRTALTQDSVEAAM
jgi:hypothetical protein